MSASDDEPATATFSVEGPGPALDAVERQLVGKRRPIVFQAIRVSHGSLRSYGSRNEYAVEPIVESLMLPEVDRDGSEISVTWGWDHEAAEYFDRGASDHTVNGDSVISFIWQDAPSSIHDMFPDTEREGGDPRVFFQSVEVSGLPASRFVLAGIEWLRQELEA